MTDCCSDSGVANNSPKKYKCPVNGNEYSEVSIITIKHHLIHSWDWQAKNQRYFFCEDPECAVVYFGEDDSMIDKSKLRQAVGIKEKSGDGLICYCFGISKNQAAKNPKLKQYVIQQTRQGSCSCETHNPSGRCCLKDFK